MTFTFADRLGVVTWVASGAERSEAALTCSDGFSVTHLLRSNPGPYAFVSFLIDYSVMFY